MLADPVLGWKGGMRPVIKFSTPGEECLNILKTSDRTWKLDTGWGGCKWHVKIFLEFDPGISEFGLGLRGWNGAGN